jgi:predicted PurR-regulated permease PerM
MHMPAQERVITISTKTIVHVIVTILILAFLWAIRDIVAAVFVALILAAVMNPFVDALGKYKVPAALAAISFYVLLLGVFTLAFVLIVPQLADQISRIVPVFGGESPQFVTALQAALDFLRKFFIEHSVGIQASIGSVQGQVPDLIRTVFGFLAGVFGGIVNLVLVFVLAFYMVVEEKEAMRWFKNLLSEKYQRFAENLMLQVQKKFGRWLIGQLCLSFIIGILYYAGLTILGVEGALLLGIFAAFAEFIPYVGPIITGIIVILVAFTQSPVTALIALALMILVQQLENNVIAPKIIQKAVGVNPVISIIAFMVGAKLFGAVGMILAIPVTTAISVAVMEYSRFKKAEEESA